MRELFTNRLGTNKNSSSPHDALGTTKGVNFASRFTHNGQSRQAPTATADIKALLAETIRTTTFQKSFQRIVALLASLSEDIPVVTLTAGATRPRTSCGSRSRLSVVTERNRSSASGYIGAQTGGVARQPRAQTRTVSRRTRRPPRSGTSWACSATALSQHFLTPGVDV